MFIKIIPYEWVEMYFGTWVADHFNTISLCLMIIGLIIALICGRKMNFRIRPYFTEQLNEQYQEPNFDEYPEETKKAKKTKTQQSPTGWTYDKDTQRWEPPQNMSTESREKWRWDPEKRIWIDREKEARIKRYQEYRKSQGKEPTFEEWKAQRLKEQEAAKRTQT